MRALLWTSLVISVGIGFVSILSAEESDKTPSVPPVKDAKAAAVAPSVTAEAPAKDTDASGDAETPADSDASFDGDAGVSDDAGVLEEPEAPVVEEEPAPPEATVEAPILPDEPPPRLLYSKGDMEASLGFSLSGDGDVNYLGFSAKFAYYMMDRLAPGLDLRYTNILGEKNTEYGYPDTISLLPLLKFVLSRKQVAPYVFATGGYEWQWGSKSAANAWILGLGGGVNVSVSKHVMINIELSALHYWYIKKKIYWYKDDDLYSMKDNSDQKIYKSSCVEGRTCEKLTDAEEIEETDAVWVGSDNTEYRCTNPAVCGKDAAFKDKADKDREWFFPLISVGVAVTF